MGVLRQVVQAIAQPASEGPLSQPAHTLICVKGDRELIQPASVRSLCKLGCATVNGNDRARVLIASRDVRIGDIHRLHLVARPGHSA